jgi:hypothetical protein
MPDVRRAPSDPAPKVIQETLPHLRPVKQAGGLELLPGRWVAGALRAGHKVIDLRSSKDKERTEVMIVGKQADYVALRYLREP